MRNKLETNPTQSGCLTQYDTGRLIKTLVEGGRAFYDCWMDCTLVVLPTIKGDPTTPYPDGLSGYINDKYSSREIKTNVHVSKHVEVTCSCSESGLKAHLIDGCKLANTWDRGDSSTNYFSCFRG